MLKVHEIDVSIGPTPILRDVALEVPSGSMCGLIGRNGAGKTTLMRTIMGALKATRGRIEFDNTDLGAEPPHKRAHLGIGFMPEDRRLVPDGLMPEVEEFRDRGATELSGGQQKFVAFARALMCGTQLLLLDEPSEGIAPVFAHRMVEILGNLKKEGESVLVAESNDQHIAPILDRTFVIERGSIVPE